jgi:hypothetical protein
MRRLRREHREEINPARRELDIYASSPSTVGRPSHSVAQSVLESHARRLDGIRNRLPSCEQNLTMVHPRASRNQSPTFSSTLHHCLRLHATLRERVLRLSPLFARRETYPSVRKPPAVLRKHNVKDAVSQVSFGRSLARSLQEKGSCQPGGVVDVATPGRSLGVIVAGLETSSPRSSFRAGVERDGCKKVCKMHSRRPDSQEGQLIVANNIYLVLAISADSHCRTGVVHLHAFVREMTGDECHPKTLSELPLARRNKRSATLVFSELLGMVASVEPNVDPNLVDSIRRSDVQTRSTRDARADVSTSHVKISK